MFRWIVLCSFLGTAGLVRAEPLSFDAALELAVQASPDIAAQTASVEAAQASAISAGRLPDPKLTVGVENVPVSGDERWSLRRDFMTMRKIGFMQDVPNGALRRAQTAAATASIDRADAERRLRVVTVRRDAALAWLSRYYLERRVALFDALDRENQLFADAVQAQLAGGRGMPADVIVPKQEAAELADRRDELEGEITKSKAALKRWVGSAANEPLAGDPRAFNIDAEHLRSHVHEHPELAVFVPMTQMAQAEVHEAEAMKRPDWGVELSYGDRGPEFSDMVSMQFTLGLPLFRSTRQNPQIVAKRRELARVETEREAMLREHNEELESQLAEYETSTRQLTRLRETRVPLARDKVRYQFASYRAGKTDLTNVLAARRELIEQQLKEIALQASQSATVAKLYFTYGEGAISSEAAR
jgi:cobalt-zinc-cadmium efflux system outer membrane protein